MMERRPLVAIGQKATDRIRDRAPPQGAASRRSNTIQEGGGAEAEQGEGRRARSMWKWRDWGLRQSGRDKSPPVQSRRSPRQSRRPPDWSRRPPRRNRRPPERDSRPPRRSRQSSGADRVGDLHGGAEDHQNGTEDHQSQTADLHGGADRA